MNATPVSVGTLFGNKVQYRIPLYQRRYGWDKTSWEVLWQNILDQAGGEASENTEHFTGPIVTREKQQHRFEVIDGQQRLMTFQIIFCAIRDLCELFNFCDLKKQVEKHLRNTDTDITDLNIRVKDSDVKLPDPTNKFFPSGYDELVFEAIVKEDFKIGKEVKEGYGKNIHTAFNEGDEYLVKDKDKVKEIRSKVFGENTVSLILDAYDYFYQEIRGYALRGPEEETLEKRISNLFKTIRFRFELVVIKPGTFQRAEEIFQSVNATGRKLSEFDYLRNDLFLRAGNKSECYYENYWIFENDPDDYDWNNDRLESFFQAFLIAKLGPDILEKDTKLFDVYQQNLKTKNVEVENEFRDLKDYGETYKHLDNDNDNAHFKEQMQFYADLSTFYDNKNDYNPGIRLLNYNNIILVQAFILHLVHKKGISYQKGQEDLEQVFRVLESYTTRRLLVDTIIGRYAYQEIINYFREINSGESNSEFSISKLVIHLAEARERRWIPDGVIRGLFKNSRVREIRTYSPYFQAGLRFTERYILYRIENWMRKNDKKEQLSFNEFPDKLERIRYGKDQDHDSRNSLGNTTFCQKGRGNHLTSFADEKKYLKTESGDLLLNKIIYECSSEWGEDQITTREESLLEGFQEMWPAKKTFTGESATPLSKPKTIPKPKIEPQWVSMIQLPCVIVSYQRQKLSKKVTFDDNSLFVCSLDAWRDLHSFIKTVDDVRRKQLKPLQQRSEQLHIESDLLKSAREEQAIVSLVTRDGHLLEGTIEDTYDDVICMEIREHTVIVSRTGLIQFETDILYEGVVED